MYLSIFNKNIIIPNVTFVIIFHVSLIIQYNIMKNIIDKKCLLLLIGGK